MSKNQQKQTYNTSAGLLNSFEGTNATDVTNLQGQTNAAAGQYNTALNSAGNAYTTGLAPATASAAALGTTGGYAAPQLNTLENQESSNLGGLDPNALSALSGQYQNLISSGGISDATAAAMQRQAVSGVSSIYGTLNQQNQRTLAATGGQGGGGETAEMARQLAQQESSAVTGVNAQVGQLRQQGTEAGLAGASNLTAAQAAAQNSAAQTFSGTQGGVAGGVQTGAGLQSQLELGSAGGLTSLAGLTAAQQQALQSATLGTQQLGIQGETGLLGAESGIANAQQGVGGNILAGMNSLGNLAGGVGKLLTGIGSGG